MKITIITQPSDIPILSCPNPDTGEMDGQWFMTLVPIRVKVDELLIHIPSGFVTDLGSIPQPFNGLIQRNDESMLAFIVHDYLGKMGTIDGFSRKKSDYVLYNIARRCGQRKAKAWATWAGTRIGGWFIGYYKQRAPTFYPVPDYIAHNVMYDTALTCEEYYLEQVE